MSKFITAQLIILTQALALYTIIPMCGLVYPSITLIGQVPAQLIENWLKFQNEEGSWATYRHEAELRKTPDLQRVDLIIAALAIAQAKANAAISSEKEPPTWLSLGSSHLMRLMLPVQKRLTLMFS